MTRARGHRCLAVLICAVATMATAVTGVTAEPEANTCHGLSELSYPTASNFTGIGETVRVVVTLGAGAMQGATMLTLNRVRFDLACDSASLGLNCSADAEVASYQGNLSTTCPAIFATDHVAGSTPNQVVFTANPPLFIPANTGPFCTLEFDVRVEERSHDDTPDWIEEVVGFDAGQGDAACNNVPPLAAGVTSASAISLCPACEDDGNPCNGASVCDPNEGCVPVPAPSCDDADPCTSDACDPAAPDPADPCVHTPIQGGGCVVACLDCPVDPDGRVTICHQTDGVRRTLRVPAAARGSHCRNHGDQCGACGPS